MEKVIKTFTPDEEQLKNLHLIRPFADIEVDHPVLHMLDKGFGTLEEWKEMMQDSNLIVMLREIQNFQQMDQDESVYKRAMINILKLRLVLYATNGYFRTRIGYDMWWMATHGDKNSYYPLVWEDHFEPYRWYMPGQAARDEPIQRIPCSGGEFHIPEEYDTIWKPDREIK